MLLKFGAIVTSGSGSLGGHTIQHSKGGMQLRKKPIPRGLPSDSQRSIRSINPVLQAGWGALTTAQQKVWNDWAISYNICNKSGDRHPLSGHSLWMKYQFEYVKRDLPFLLSPADMGPPYVGPELINQVLWATAGYWDFISPNTFFDGIKIIYSGGDYSVICRKNSGLWLPGTHSYMTKTTATGTGILAPTYTGDSPQFLYAPSTSVQIITATGGFYCFEYSFTFIGSITELSLKQYSP
jgi:hypothetical protein